MYFTFNTNDELKLWQLNDSVRFLLEPPNYLDSTSWYFFYMVIVHSIAGNTPRVVRQFI